jgi:heat-inducible transcriptional repressor
MELDLRKQRILRAIVIDYVATAEPVGSHVLVERYSLGVKSATIRNEMAEMSERGFLRQPHTSAGRVPSDQGYRFYVNRLMPLPVVQDGEVRQIRRAVASASSELDAILRQTCRLLAEMTSLPAVATSPDSDDTELRQIFVAAAGTDKALLALLFSTGRTENRLISDLRLTASDALYLANALNERFVSKSLAELSVLAQTNGRSDEGPPPELIRFGRVWQRIVHEIAGAAINLRSEVPVFIEGTQAALNLPEFRDVERLGQFLSLIQERAALLEMLETAVTSSTAPAVQVVIGEESGRPAMSEYSLVSASYYIGTRERGSIGVLGPTRMDYARASAAVELMAKTMTEILTRLSIAP